ncbi:hypothetical protein AVEN_50823-1 [Araneus ventricosus]|uniref:Uncharacterized protein n=1 Tax=Araneus ventricosus TaxID=182803 RepID=A0A4Y2IUV8_ARAVE|nr:hypothetical protein AVEN_50823-1 [Araneus ventricosus]
MSLNWELEHRYTNSTYIYHKLDRSHMSSRDGVKSIPTLQILPKAIQILNKLLSFGTLHPGKFQTLQHLQNKTSDSRHDTNIITAVNVGIDSNSVVQTAPESKGALSSVRTRELHSLDPDTEMRTSSSSEDDILEYEMSEELEETSSDGVCTPSLPRPKKYIIPTKYKQK